MLNEQTILDILTAKAQGNEERIYELTHNLHILDECKADFYACLVESESLDDFEVRRMFNSSLIYGTTGVRV